MSKEQNVKLWITKYALTSGMAVRICTISGGMASVLGTWHEHYHGDEWHRSEAKARAKVLEMIAAKRKSIAKTITKLDSLEASLRK